MVQCPFNGNHYVPRTSLEKHKEKCRYAVLGVDPDLVEDMVQCNQPDLTVSKCLCVRLGLNIECFNCIMCVF